MIERIYILVVLFFFKKANIKEPGRVLVYLNQLFPFPFINIISGFQVRLPHTDLFSQKYAGIPKAEVLYIHDEINKSPAFATAKAFIELLLCINRE